MNNAKNTAKKSQVPKKAQRPRKKQTSSLAKWLKRFMALTIYGLVAGVFVVIWYGWDLPDPADLLQTANRQASYQLLDHQGKNLLSAGENYGDAVSLDALPDYIPNALLAIEDHRFYYHPGLDPIAIMRAAYVNFTQGGKRQGGSTITQQLAKTLFLTADKTLRRKAQEALLSIWLEVKFTKQQILEIYMSRVYMGGGNWGFSAAAEAYFGRDLHQLNLRQATILAALPLAPSRLNPHYNAKDALERADLTLKRMVDLGYISHNQSQTAKAQSLGLIDDGFADAHKLLFANRAIEEARDFMAGAGQDLIITTRLDRKLQQTAEQVIQEFSRSIKAKGADQIALLAVDHIGGVRAMITGLNDEKNRFNRALLAKRQPGSSFKLFVYLAALESGWQINDMVIDEPINVNGWQPKNYSQRYYGAVSLLDAFAASSNIVAVKLGLDVGVDEVIAHARRLGINSDLAPHPSLFLGSSEVSLTEMVGAYASILSDQDYIVPSLVKKIQDGNGNILFEGARVNQQFSTDNMARQQMRQLLSYTISHGTARQAHIPELADAGWQMMGKTGTSQDYRDAWFLGGVINPTDHSSLTMGIWIGNDDASPTNEITGGALPACIWREIIKQMAFLGKPINTDCQ